MSLTSVIILISFQPVDSAQADSLRGPVIASVAQLTVDPERWLNRDVVVKGYLARQISLFLYTSEDQSRITNYASGIGVIDPEHGSSDEFSMGCTNSYAEIRGRFVSRDGQPSIDLIEEVKLYDASTDSWSRCWPFSGAN